MNKLSIIDPYYIEERSIHRGIVKALKYLNGNFLDIGCGGQAYKNLIRPKVTVYFALDKDIRVFKDCDGIHTVGDFYHLPFKSGVLDSVLSSQTLEMATKPDLVVQEMNRVLKQGGFLVLSVSQTWPLWSEYDYFRFTSKGIGYLLYQAGFEIVTLEPRGGFWVLISQLVNIHIHHSTSGCDWKKGMYGLLNRITDYFKNVIVVAISLIGPLFDVLDKQKLNTLGYIVVAKKLR